MIAIRKTPQGKLEARSDGQDQWIFIGRAKRVVNGKRFTAKQFVSVQTGKVIIGLSSICMQMLRTEQLPEDELCFYKYDEYEGGDPINKSVHVYWPNPVYLILPNMCDTGYIYLVNEDGRALSGSNVWSDGRLCLNSSFTPFNLEALDALIYNEANTDLRWAGATIPGEWEEQEGMQRTFMMREWPTFTQVRNATIPPTIIAEVNNG